MTKTSELSIAAALALCFILPGTARAQTDRGVIHNGIPVGCSNNQCQVVVATCTEGYRPCTWAARSVQCPCDINEYVGSADTSGTCSQSVRQTQRPPDLKALSGVARAFTHYIPNCKGEYSFQEIVT